MKEYKCKICSYVTEKASDIANHYQLTHNAEHEFTCDLCGKIFKSHRYYVNHEKFNTCQIKANKTLIRHDNIGKVVNCEICGKEIKFYGFGSHMWRIHGDGNIFNHKIPDECRNFNTINKGKTFDEIYGTEKSQVIKQKIIKAIVGKRGACTGIGKTIDIENSRKRKISEKIKDRYKSGWMPKAGRCEKIRYHSNIAGDVLLDGTWELKVSQYFDENNMKWIRNTKRFQYFNTIKNKNAFYTPDFYLINENKYIEVKGYETELDRIKWSQFTEPLEVWKRKELIKLGLKL